MKRVTKNICRTLVVGLPLFLTACGFQPLYGDLDGTSPVVHKLASVEVVEQKSRVGQLIRNEIISGITPAGAAAGQSYRLEIAPKSSESSVIDGVNTESLRQQYRLNVDFTLYEGVSGRPIFNGKTFSQVSYDRVVSPVANLQARTNATERAAKEVGLDIRTRLAAYFSTN